MTPKTLGELRRSEGVEYLIRKYARSEFPEGYAPYFEIPGDEAQEIALLILALESEIERLKARRVEDMRACWDQAEKFVTSRSDLRLDEWLTEYDKGQK